MKIPLAAVVSCKALLALIAPMCLCAGVTTPEFAVFGTRRTGKQSLRRCHFKDGVTRTMGNRGCDYLTRLSIRGSSICVEAVQVQGRLLVEAYDDTLAESKF